MRKHVIPALLIVCAAMAALTATAGEKMTPEQLNAMLAGANQAAANMKDFTCTFHKQEMINGKLLKEETMFVKFALPMKVYMKWIKNPFEGRETLYVKGWNDNKLKAHEGGFFKLIKVNLNPTGSMAMKGNRHPVTEFGMHQLLQKMDVMLKKGLAAGELEVIVHGSDTVYGRKTEKIEGILPKDPAKGYYCYRAVIWFDNEIKLPIKVNIYDWDNNLVENFAFENLKLNPGLTDADFDPQNPEYKF